MSGRAVKKDRKKEEVLICSLGASPQVVTEVLDKLVVERKRAISEVVLVHTDDEKVRRGLESLRRELAGSYPAPVAMRALSTGSVDITDRAGNDAVRRLIFDVCCEKKRQGCTVHVSIAGGRKTMSAYMFLAAQIFGADHVYHVIVPPELESGFHPPLERFDLIEVPHFDLSPVLEKLSEVTGMQVETAAGAESLLRALPGLAGSLAIRKIEDIDNDYDVIGPGEPNEFHGLVYASRSMAEAVKRAATVAAAPDPVLITGPTGCGKELLASAIHEESGRKGKFVPVNCAAIPESLFESEMFGVVRGAFTGAIEKAGHIERADGGTLFLDEIGKMPLQLQPKLLRVIDDKVVQRLGSETDRRVNFRFVAATNADLHALVEKGQFADDLFSRINVFPVRIPSLRDRPEDKEILLAHFLEASKKCNRKKIAAGAWRRLIDFDYPDNVRGIENVVKDLSISCGDTIKESDVARVLREHYKENQVISSYGPIENAITKTILEALKKESWNLTRTAKRLEWSLNTLKTKMDKYGIPRRPVKH